MIPRNLLLAGALAALGLGVGVALAADNEAGVPLSPTEAAGGWTVETGGHAICMLRLTEDHRQRVAAVPGGRGGMGRDPRRHGAHRRRRAGAGAVQSLEQQPVCVAPFDRARRAADARPAERAGGQLERRPRAIAHALTTPDQRYLLGSAGACAAARTPRQIVSVSASLRRSAS